MVTIHKSDKKIAPIVQTTPEIDALLIKGPLKIDLIHAALLESYKQLANAAFQLDANHSVHAFLRQLHKELYTIESVLDEQNNLFTAGEESL